LTRTYSSSSRRSRWLNPSIWPSPHQAGVDSRFGSIEAVGHGGELLEDLALELLEDLVLELLKTEV
jgi:hypothetical protein